MTSYIKEIAPFEVYADSVGMPEMERDKPFLAWVAAKRHAAQEVAIPAQAGTYAPKFDQAEFDKMVDAGTKAWSGVPDGWLEKLRGGEDARDAARYRWLRGCGAEFDNLSIFDARGNLIAEEFDAAIDEAMQPTTGKEPT